MADAAGGHRSWDSRTHKPVVVIDDHPFQERRLFRHPIIRSADPAVPTVCSEQVSPSALSFAILYTHNHAPNCSPCVHEQSAPAFAAACPAVLQMRVTPAGVDVVSVVTVSSSSHRGQGEKQQESH